jgi:hypothetical protein
MDGRSQRLTQRQPSTPSVRLQSRHPGSRLEYHLRMKLTAKPRMIDDMSGNGLAHSPCWRYRFGVVRSFYLLALGCLLSSSRRIPCLWARVVRISPGHRRAVYCNSKRTNASWCCAWTFWTASSRNADRSGSRVSCRKVWNRGNDVIRCGRGWRFGSARALVTNSEEAGSPH